MDARMLRAAALLWGASLLLVGAGALAAGLAATQLLRLLLVCALIGLPLWIFVVRGIRAAPRDAAPSPGAETPARPGSPVPPVPGALSSDSLLLREQQMLAERDALTGCLNRRALLERLGRLCAQSRASGQPLCCALFAIDGFALLAARHGQDTADRLLGLVARTARDNLRDVDLLARWSASEFCVVQPATAPEMALQGAERIRRAIADLPDERLSADERLSLGVGLVALDDAPADAPELMERAALALGEAQAAGAGRIVRWSAGTVGPAPGLARDGAVAALVDPCTGLPGAAVFRERVELGVAEALRAQRTTAVALMRVQRGGTPGAAAPDELRLQMSIRLRNALRAVDTVALMDGERQEAGAGAQIGLFGVLVNDLPDPRMAANILRRVAAQVAEPIETPTGTQGVSLATGVALAPQDATDTAVLLAAAGSALDAARRREARISCEFVTAGMNQVYVDQERFRAELGQALAGDELELHFLPRFELATGRISGLEALVRWNHPVRGQLQPAQFINTAETAGMIVPLGNWVIEHAIAEAARWRAAGHPELVVCVNLSPFQFRQLNLVELTAELLARHGLDAHNLEIEVAEASVIRNTEPAIALINRLNRSGVRIAIDDFGTGYAVLKYLRRFPANTVKIDRSLVAEVHSDNRDATIVSAIVALAGSLGIDTVAEGVETEAQSATLRSLGCRAAQGFLFSRPLRAPDVPEFLARNAARTDAA